MLNTKGEYNHVYFPPYAFEAHIYLNRGDKKSIETVEQMGGLSLFF